MLVNMAFKAELVDGIRGECAVEDTRAYIAFVCDDAEVGPSEIECEHDQDTDLATADLTSLLRARVVAGVDDLAIPHEQTILETIDALEGYAAYLRGTLLPLSRDP